MFGLGIGELLLIFAIALIVFGPKRLPDIGRTIGKTLAEFKKATDELKNTVEREVRLDELRQISSPLATPVETVSRTEPAQPEVTPAVPAPVNPEHPSEI